MVFSQLVVVTRKLEFGVSIVKLLEKVSSHLNTLIPFHRALLHHLCIMFPVMTEEAVCKCHPFSDLLRPLPLHRLLNITPRLPRQ
jgi:hypothetical protein